MSVVSQTQAQPADIWYWIEMDSSLMPSASSAATFDLASQDAITFRIRLLSPVFAADKQPAAVGTLDITTPRPEVSGALEITGADAANVAMADAAGAWGFALELRYRGPYSSNGNVTPFWDLRQRVGAVFNHITAPGR